MQCGFTSTLRPEAEVLYASEPYLQSGRMGPIGRIDREGVVDLDCQVHNYPGLYVAPSCPATPGINARLTIAALAEYAMSRIPAKKNR